MKKFIIFTLSILSIALPLVGIVLVYYRVGHDAFFDQTILYSSLSGWLGSGIYMTRGFYQSVAETGERAFDFKWLWWYLSRPFLGLVAGLLAFLLVSIAFDIEQTFKNQLAVIFLSFLFGYNFHHLMEKRIDGKIDLI